ncbi:RHS repeat-associated core domain-containing protein [Candidatus Electrothrix aarhusensis]|uniref:RHS repeat-associated core domain-containing protein n=1 Tax=Candidatus Electrothrix aarhusensis TaxID=1859131 RepID=A0A444IUM2_9BACT|nr:RHS repeat-associated core domain-containing protein [Candidatus Electrothrix aarhusensis]
MPVSLYQEIEKDIYGNTTKEYQYGIIEGTDRAAGGDEILTDTAYDIDTDAWLINLPKEVSSIALDGSFIARKRFFYDEKGNLLREEGSPDGTAFIPLLRNEYDNYGNIILITDANEKCRNIYYDAQFHTFPIQESICGLNLLMEAEYDTGLGVITEHRDFNQQVTQYDYDPLGRLTAIIRPGDTLALPTQSFAYQVGNPLSAVRTSLREQAGSTATYDSITYYDGLGRKLQTRSEDDKGRWIVSNAVDFNLRRQPNQQWQPYFSSTAAYEAPDPSKPLTHLFYDAKARVREQVNPDSTIRRTEFAPLSRIEYDEEDMATGGLHANTPTRFFSDGLERLIRVEEQNGTEIYVTRYGYDGLNNLINIEDNEQNSKTMTFDGLGRKLYMNDPDKHEMFYGYDPGGNLTSTLDAENQEIIYTYDAANRILTEVFQGQEIVRYHYDEDFSLDCPDLENTLGKIAWIEDQAGTVCFSYDQRGNMTAKKRALGGRTFISRMAYDSMDRLVEQTWPDGFTLRHVYDRGNRLTALPGFVDSITYNAAGAITDFMYTNGIASLSEYDERLRLKHRRGQVGSDPVLQDLRFDYDGVGNITVMTDQRSAKTPEDRSRSFVYDDLYRLTSATAPDWTRTYAYSSIGNMIYKSDIGEIRHGENGAGPHAPTSVPDAGLIYRYDANGNLSAKEPEFSTVFDQYNRMVRTEQQNSGPVTEYLYDSGGQRLSKQVRTGGDTETTLYPDKYTELRSDRLIKRIYAGNRLVARVSVPFDPDVLATRAVPLRAGDFDTAPADGRISLEEIRAQGKDSAALETEEVADALRIYLEHLESDSELLSFATIAQALHELGDLGEGAEGEVLFYLPDHLGSPSVVTDADGAVVEESVFYPYGADRAQTGSVDSEYRFTGKELDGETGLHYFEARYYDSVVGRFVSVDPLIEASQEELDTYINIHDNKLTDQYKNNLMLASNYNYTNSNPLIFIDPDGEWLIPVIGAVAVVVVILNIVEEFKESADMIDQNKEYVETHDEIDALIHRNELLAPGEHGQKSPMMQQALDMAEAVPGHTLTADDTLTSFGISASGNEAAKAAKDTYDIFTELNAE